jgi:hypothetical protein
MVRDGTMSLQNGTWADITKRINMKTKNKKAVKKTKPKQDWFDSHVEVMGFGDKESNNKLKALIKQKVMKGLERT